MVLRKCVPIQWLRHQQGGADGVAIWRPATIEHIAPDNDFGGNQRRQGAERKNCAADQPAPSRSRSPRDSAVAAWFVSCGCFPKAKAFRYRGPKLRSTVDRHRVPVSTLPVTSAFSGRAESRGPPATAGGRRRPPAPTVSIFPDRWR